MSKNLLHPEHSESLLQQMKVVWNKEKYYWYPLTDTLRDSVLALNAAYLGNQDIIAIIKKPSIEQSVIMAYEFREYGRTFELPNILEHRSWNQDSYFNVSECYWFNDRMDWIIYTSHEGTTFGGNRLVQYIKETPRRLENACRMG